MFKEFLVIIVGVALLFIVLLLFVCGIGYSLSPNVEVFVNGNKIFTGNTMCVYTESAGNKTMVAIQKDTIFCIGPTVGMYIAEDVVINPVK